MSDPVTILIIDDSEDDRALYRRALGKSYDVSYVFSEANGGEEGLKCADSETPDCVLLDYSLPGRNGIEVLKQLRARHAFVPVVILTGQGNETVAVSAMKEGAQDYITKSAITPDTLERVVRVAIERAELEEHIHEQRTALEIFAHALAHDLKEPTNTILSFVELIMEKEPLSERGRGYFGHVQKASRRMQQLIDTVHLYTRIDTTEQVTHEACDVAAVLEEVRENLSQLIGAEKAVITHDTLPIVTANRTQLLQLLQNLIANAIRHGGAGVAIHVGASEQPEHWQIYVRDNGPGIEAQHMENIFTPFKRMSNTAERGLGLGLAISHKIVESHGGRIWCESVFGAGATFFFTLPKAAAGAPERQAAPRASVAVSGGGQQLARLLLVDDNESDIALNRITLVDNARLRCDLMIATDGREALQKMSDARRQKNPVDIVLLDINMPVMSGFELLAHMHKEGLSQHTTVVMCSTSAYEKDKEMAMAMGAAGYLTKPPQFTQFQSIVEQTPRLRFCRKGEDYALWRAS